MAKACMKKQRKQGKSYEEAYAICYPKDKAKKKSNQTGVKPSGEPNRRQYAV